jgi:hypothetical protein
VNLLAFAVVFEKLDARVPNLLRLIALLNYSADGAACFVSWHSYTSELFGSMPDVVSSPSILKTVAHSSSSFFGYSFGYSFSVSGDKH